MANGQPSSEVFAAIADETRRSMLLRLLDEGEMNVSELQEPLPMSQPAVSKHLRVLREAGLIRSRKEGRQTIYEVQPHRRREVHDWVSRFEAYWDDKLDALGDFLKKEAEKRG